MKDIKFVLFDIGGVLIEYKNAFKTAALEQNVPIEILDAAFDNYDKEITTGYLTPQELWIKCITENNLKADPKYDFLHSWLNDNIPIQQAYELVEKLAPNYSIGLFSNIYKGFVPEMIRAKQIPNIHYEKYFLSCDIKMQKPDKEVYEYVQNNCGVKPNELLFVDDKLENLVPAENLGWETFKFDRHSPEDSVNKLATLLL